MKTYDLSDKPVETTCPYCDCCGFTDNRGADCSDEVLRGFEVVNYAEPLRNEI
jgi:hypothetical protein